MSTTEILTRTIRAAAGADATPRPDQVTAVTELVDRRQRVLVVQATGWGKSAVYWGATAALRANGAGPTLVVSPLLALMRDQIAAAERAGLHAATINSTNYEEWDQVLAALGAGAVDVLLISPERLANPRFAARLPELLGQVGLLVIDEAHCVSDWGFDFRPDYQRLTRTLLDLAPGTPVLATTATANQRVTTDVAAQLGADTITLRGSLARSSLRLAVVPGLSPLERYAWVAEALTTLPGSGIIYVLTVAEADRVTAFLQHRGLDVAAYTGRTENRAELEDRLRDNRIKALVATSALGMGYDKPDLAFCLHLGSPASPVALGREHGRGGVDGDDVRQVHQALGGQAGLVLGLVRVAQPERRGTPAVAGGGLAGAAERRGAGNCFGGGFRVGVGVGAGAAVGVGGARGGGVGFLQEPRHGHRAGDIERTGRGHRSGVLHPARGLHGACVLHAARGLHGAGSPHRAGVLQLAGALDRPRDLP